MSYRFRTISSAVSPRARTETRSRRRARGTLLAIGSIPLFVFSCSGASDDPHARSEANLLREEKKAEEKKAEEKSVMSTFLDCLNKANGGKPTPADAVKCMPSGCKIRLIDPAKRPRSAQPGCFYPKEGVNQCALPRVILECGEGIGRFEPSFSLCPTSANNGSQRIETCVVADKDGNRIMGDIPIPVGNFKALDVKDVISKPDTDPATDTKGCGACHTANNKSIVDIVKGGDLDGAAIIPPILVKDADILKNGGKEVKISEICECIKDKKPFGADAAKYAYLAELCKALADYEKGDGGKGGEGGQGGQGGTGGKENGGGPSRGGKDTSGSGGTGNSSTGGLSGGIGAQSASAGVGGESGIGGSETGSGGITLFPIDYAARFVLSAPR